MIIKIYQNLLLKNGVKTSLLRSDLCDFSDAYIVVTGDIIVTKKRFAASDFERSNNTNLATNTNNANNIAFGEKKKHF